MPITVTVYMIITGKAKEEHRINRYHKNSTKKNPINKSRNLFAEVIKN